MMMVPSMATVELIIQVENNRYFIKQDETVKFKNAATFIRNKQTPKVDDCCVIIEYIDSKHLVMLSKLENDF